jgi:RimJ/RimL family protein N-acetyltransferase
MAGLLQRLFAEPPPSPPVVATGRLLLRPLDARDLGALAAIYGDAAVTRYLQAGPYDAVSGRRVARALLRRARRRPAGGTGTLGVVERRSGRLVGTCGLQPLAAAGRIELSYVLGRPWWGRGYATEAAGALMRHGFDALDLDELVAVVHPDNAASRRVVEKLGFGYEGLLVCYGGLYPCFARGRR